MPILNGFWKRQLQFWLSLKFVHGIPFVLNSIIDNIEFENRLFVFSFVINFCSTKYMQYIRMCMSLSCFFFLSTLCTMYLSIYSCIISQFVYKSNCCESARSIDVYSYLWAIYPFPFKMMTFLSLAIFRKKK